MISYSPKHWFLFIFRIHKAETFRQLFPLILLISLYSFIVVFVLTGYFGITQKSRITGLSVVYSVLGFVISLLLVFRTNTAYERWWEGRKLWGSLVNCSRNLTMKICSFLPADKHREFKNLISLYPLAMKNHLQGLPMNEADLENFPFLKEVRHKPNLIARAILQGIVRNHSEGNLNETQLLVLNTEWQQLTEICGACERIRNTPIPFSYSAFVKKFLFFYTMLMPFAYVGSLEYLVVPLVAFIFYVLASIEIIAEEIENPFGLDTNDLPLEHLCSVIRQSTEEIFEFGK